MKATKKQICQVMGIVVYWMTHVAAELWANDPRSKYDANHFFEKSLMGEISVENPLNC